MGNETKVDTNYAKFLSQYLKVNSFLRTTYVFKT